MTSAVTQLQRLRFSEYEARAYVALLQRSPLNGYELAKASGLPRANIYGVLQKLEERGAVVRLDAPSGARFAPVSPEELLQRLRSGFQVDLEAAQHSLEEIATPAEYEYVWNARGYPVLLEHARVLVDGTREQLLVAIWPREAAVLADSLARAQERGIEITTLCLAGCPNECGGCRGRVHRYQVAPEERNRWLVLVPDEAEVLAGEISPNEEALAVRTRQRLLVALTGWYIRHSIVLAAMVSDLGGRLEGLLKPETRSILASVWSGGPRGGWLEHMGRIGRHKEQPPDARQIE